MLSKILSVSFHSVMGWAGNNICSQTIQKEIRTRQRRIWIVSNPQLFLYGFGCIRCIQRTNLQLFESALHGGNFLIRYESGIVWTFRKSGYFFIQWRQKIEPKSLPWIFKMVPSAMLSLLYFLDFSFKVYNLCVVKPSNGNCAPQLCQTAARHFEASFHVGRTNWTP